MRTIAQGFKYPLGLFALVGELLAMFVAMLTGLVLWEMVLVAGDLVDSCVDSVLDVLVLGIEEVLMMDVPMSVDFRTDTGEVLLVVVTVDFIPGVVVTDVGVTVFVSVVLMPRKEVIQQDVVEIIKRETDILKHRLK